MSKRLKMERGLANVFVDVGFPRAEAEVLLLRAQMMLHIREMARRSKPRSAASMLGISRTRLNDLLQRNMSRFDLDSLVKMAAHAGLRIELKIKKGASARQPR